MIYVKNYLYEMYLKGYVDFVEENCNTYWKVRKAQMQINTKIQRPNRTKAEGMELESNVRILSRTKIIQVMSTSHDLLVQQMLNLGLNK